MNAKIPWQDVNLQLALLQQVQQDKVHLTIGNGTGAAWDRTANHICSHGAFHRFGHVKGPAIKKQFEKICSSALSQFENNSGGSTDDDDVAYAVHRLARSLCEARELRKTDMETARSETLEAAQRQRSTMLAFEESILENGLSTAYGHGPCMTNSSIRTSMASSSTAIYDDVDSVDESSSSSLSLDSPPHKKSRNKETKKSKAKKYAEKNDSAAMEFERAIFASMTENKKVINARIEEERLNNELDRDLKRQKADNDAATARAQLEHSKVQTSILEIFQQYLKK